MVFYREGDAVPVREWLKSIPIKAQRKCLTYLHLLETDGHDLRRPVADFLRDGIYELRPSYQGVNYRLLYFFVGRNVIVVSHGIAKEAEVPVSEIERALRHKRNYERDPAAHTYRRAM